MSFPPYCRKKETKEKQKKYSKYNLYLPPGAAYSFIPSASPDAEACSSSAPISSLSPTPLPPEVG